MSISTVESVCNSQFDVCIVGAGPVGLATAMECESLGLSVLIIEAGNLEPAQPPTKTYTDVLDSSRHAPMEIAVGRAMGGTSWFWGGRCVPLDTMDFEKRQYVLHSGWPIAREEVAQWYDRAAIYLDCGGADFFARPDEFSWHLNGFRTNTLERWSRQPRLGAVHFKRLEQSERIHILLNSTVTEIEFGDKGRSVDHLTVATGTIAQKTRARRYVLACGGVETTRMLLKARRRQPALFGGPDGALGRYYMGHVFGKIADIILDEPGDAKYLDFSRDDSGTYVRRRICLLPWLLDREKIQNTAFLLDNPPFYAAHHGSGILSLTFLALLYPPLGRRLVSEGIRLMHIGQPPYRVKAHLMNIVRHPLGTMAAIINILHDRYLAKVRKPGFLIRNIGGRYAIYYHGEQEPRPDDNRIRLANEKHDASDDLVIEVNFSESDVRSIVRAHELFDAALRASDIGRLDYIYPLENLSAHVLRQARDGFHQIGATRMGNDSAESVVDASCRTHGVENLYIASSSVFPTSGHANPTLTATALGIRLAHHMASLA